MSSIEQLKKLKPSEITKTLNSNAMFWHGNNKEMEKWKLPKCVTLSTESIRADQKNNIKGHEFLDHPDVLDAKMKMLAEMIQKSKNMICYTGAGISSAVVNCYAKSGPNSIIKKVNKRGSASAKPTYTHYAIANLGKHGYLKRHINQNHDGLVQKAGMPEEKCNEIHGAWFENIANPVVQFSENLRSDLFKDLLFWEEKADLCLCMGTSLSGMNADRCVSTPMEKFAGQEENCMGSVVINLQQTPLDIPGYTPLRIWAKTDDAMKLLAKHLKMTIEKKGSVRSEDKTTIPYNSKGRFDQSKKMVLDLTPGAKVIVTQPGCKRAGKIGVVQRRDGEGNFLIAFPDRLCRLGRWWPDVFRRGAKPIAVLVNVKPKFL